MQRGTTTGCRAFTLLELMIAIGLFGLVMAASLGVYVMCQKFWYATALNMQTDMLARMALSRMINGVGTNVGLREATSAVLYMYPETVANSAYIHSHLTPATYTYWENSSLVPPQDKDAAITFTCNFPTFDDGGSWRLMFSNAVSGAQYIDYNCPYRTLSLGTNAAKRTLLANYVQSAMVSTNGQGIAVTLTVFRRVGSLVSSNTATSYVQFRN
jgi:prepilin-type N-terminal cleavage/methylation domain-containing protein